MDPSDQSALVARLQAFFYIVRSGQWESALAILTLALFGSAEYLRREFKESPKAGYSTYALCAIVAVWLVVSVWKKAAPPPPPSEKPLPNAIKGLLPFTASDGALFVRLGRRIELQSLLALAQNDQIPISTLRGESGSGKTSLLQAGLAYTLGEEHCVYWEAVPARAPEALLHAIRSRPGLETIYRLESLPDACPKRCVVILDQLEQLRANLPEHAPVFSLLERIGKSLPPHKLSAVVGFRRDYAPDWLDFEQAHGLRAEQMSVNLLAQRTARDVLVTLSGEAGFTLDQALVTNFISRVTRSDEGVSPIDIAIGILSLANFIQRRGTSHLDMAEYELSGGAEGLLLSFVQQKLEEIPEAIRAPLLKGLVLTLVDLSNNQRIVAGETASVIAARAEMPQSSLVPSLERLAHPRIRLLEHIGSDRYRLPHERLVPVLRRLTGRVLAAVDQRRLIFETEYARWCETRNRRHLVAGKDLRWALRQLDQYILGENRAAKTEYMAACLRRRTMLRLAVSGAGIAGAAGVYGALRVFDTVKEKQALKSWGLPPELLLAQYSLDVLDVSPGINDVSWLRSLRLRDLRVNFTGASLAGLEQLKNLKSLSLSLIRSKMTSMAGLERLKNLTTLDLSLDSKITTMAGLEQLDNLTSFSLGLYNSKITSLAGLEQLKNLKSLRLRLVDSEIDSLAGLDHLQNLTSLELSFWGDVPKITSLAGVEQLKSLTSLDLDLTDSEITSLAELEQLKSLTTFKFRPINPKITSLAGLEQLRNLTSLDLDLMDSKVTSLAGLEQLKNLTSLDLSLDSKVTSLAGLEQLKNLKAFSLSLGDSEITSLAGLEHLQNLTSLDLSSDSKVTSLAGLEQLKTLTSLELGLMDSEITSLAELEQLRNLTSLDLHLSDSKVTSLAGLEHLQNLTSLRLSGGVAMTILGGLGQLKSLTSLELIGENSTMTSLVWLEQLKNLTSLKLEVGEKIMSLAGLEHLQNLTSLDLSLLSSNITSLVGLEQLKNLTSITLWLPLLLVLPFAQLKISAPHKQVTCLLT